MGSTPGRALVRRPVVGRQLARMPDSGGGADSSGVGAGRSRTARAEAGAPLTGAPGTGDDATDGSAIGGSATGEAADGSAVGGPAPGDTPAGRLPSRATRRPAGRVTADRGSSAKPAARPADATSATAASTTAASTTAASTTATSTTATSTTGTSPTTDNGRLGCEPGPAEAHTRRNPPQRHQLERIGRAVGRHERHRGPFRRVSGQLRTDTRGRRRRQTRRHRRPGPGQDVEPQRHLVPPARVAWFRRAARADLGAVVGRRTGERTRRRIGGSRRARPLRCTWWLFRRDRTATTEISCGDPAGPGRRPGRASLP